MKKGIIESVETTENYRKRPQPLNTIALQKLLSQNYNFDSKESMEVAESLYNLGLISYPRTETTVYEKSINLRPFIQAQLLNPNLTDFAASILDGKMWGGPNNGKSDDKAHPPIHPVAYPSEDKVLRPIQKTVYDFICRHFLASVSKDAVYEEKKYIVKFGEETFVAQGQKLKEKNFMEVYKDRYFSESPCPDINQGDSIRPTGLKMEESATRPPPLLSESALISLMDKHGIGTDATIHEHINKIKIRGYAYKEYNFFKPTPIGFHLIEAYSKLGFNLEKPDLRAEMERDMKAIEKGEMEKQEGIS
jgi:DNA topoisomerase III